MLKKKNKRLVKKKKMQKAKVIRFIYIYLYTHKIIKIL